MVGWSPCMSVIVMFGEFSAGEVNHYRALGDLHKDKTCIDVGSKPARRTRRIVKECQALTRCLTRACRDRGLAVAVVFPVQLTQLV